MNVRLTQEQKIQILNSEDLYNVMQQILLRENKIGRNQEHFWVVGLDNRNKILFVELIGLGANNRVSSDPADVFRMGIYKLATKMILVHNHPSGNLDPSQEDLDFTDRMIKSGKLLKIKVIDSFIISEESYTSLAAEGIFKELENNGRYELQTREKTQLQEIKLQIEKEKAEKAKAKEIAKKLKDEGMDTEFIQKITGLRKDVIGRL